MKSTNSTQWKTAVSAKKIQVDDSTKFSVVFKIEKNSQSTYSNIMLGISDRPVPVNQYIGSYSTKGYSYYGSSSGYKYFCGSSQSYGSPFKAGDQIEMKINCREIRYVLNGTDLGVAHVVNAGEYHIAVSLYDVGDCVSVASMTFT